MYNKKFKIIVVEDDRETRELLQLALELEGYEVHVAANGIKLIASLEVNRPDLILMDVMMSWIDGFELCKAIKLNKAFSDIPVVFLSGRNSPEDIQRGIEVGAAGYIQKPFQLEALFNKLKTILQLTQVAMHI